MREPNVSVIVPVYKTEKYLYQCLDSILKQTLSDIEVIIVDEGDHDECRKIIDDYEARDSRIKGIHKRNGGYGASVNLGIDLAKGEYIGIVESDDFIASDMYEKLYTYAKSLDADVVKAPFYDYFEYLSRREPLKILDHDSRFLCKNLPKDRTFSIRECPCLMGGHASIWSGIYRIGYLRDNGIYFPEARGGYVDAVFRPKSLMYTDKIAWLNEPFYCWRKTSEDSTTNNFNLSTMLMRWAEVHELFQKEHELYQIVGPYSVDNEYGCSLAMMYQQNFTEEQYQALLQNMAYTRRELIETSPVLTPRKKQELLALKEDPEQFRQEIRKKQRMQKYLRPALDILSPKGTKTREWLKAIYHRMRGT